MADEEIRRRSLKVLAGRGLTVPLHLPIPDLANPRSAVEIVERLLCLNAVAAVAHGFDTGKALTWLAREHLESKLIWTERAFLQRGQGSRCGFQLQVEAMWGRAWALGIVSELEFWRKCSSEFVALLPNLKIDESVERLTAQINPIETGEIIAARDLSYCLHWIIRDIMMRNDRLPPDLEPYTVIERRRALEWILGEEPWEELATDT